jgi:hypothetical protein
MLICTNCLAEHTDIHTTTCTVCRMPFPKKVQPDDIRVTVITRQPVVQKPIAVLCHNCAEELPEGKISQCPNCSMPLRIPEVLAVPTVARSSGLGEAKTDSGMPELRLKPQRP